MSRWTAPKRRGKITPSGEKPKPEPSEEKQKPLLEGYEPEDSRSYRERIHYIALLAEENEQQKTDAQNGFADETRPAIVLWHGYAKMFIWERAE